MEFDSFKIVGVERELIEKDMTFEAAYKYPFILNARPDDQWVKFFHSVYRMHSFDKKRQYAIVDKQILVIISGDDNKQVHLDFLKDCVELTNQKYKQVIIAREEEKRKEETKKKREREKIQEMRAETNKLNFD